MKRKVIYLPDYAGRSLIDAIPSEKPRRLHPEVKPNSGGHMKIEEMNYDQLQEMIDVDSRAYTRACACVERLKSAGGQALVKAEKVRDDLSLKMQKLLARDSFLRMRGEVFCHQQLG